jgi:tetratricopeptide (TPR) repeat protein
MENLEQQIEFYEKELVSAREIGDREGEANAFFYLGFTYWSLDRNEDAIRCYEQAFILDPDYPYLWYYKGESLEELGRHEEAIYCFDKELELDPGEMVHWYSKGVSLASLDRLELAIQCFDKALELDSEYQPPWFDKGNCLIKLGRYEDALCCFDKSVKFRPRYEHAWYRKAKAEDYLGRKDDAIRSYRQLLTLPRKDNLEEIEITHQRLEELTSDRPLTLHDLQAGFTYNKGDIIGKKYEVYRILGKGGFGVVYLVHNRQTGEVDALKTFQDKYLIDQEVRKRFQKEANVWVELGRHPYLVHANFVDKFSGRLYIEMEYIAPNEEGLNSLEGYLQRQPPDLAQSLRWAIQICHGMEYAYSKGVRAHRDLKPANIMISLNMTAKITDFGLAGVINESLVKNPIRMVAKERKPDLFIQTMVGAGFGTPTHMAPEQFDNAAGCDERSDIYSFGIMLYQMITGGRVPFLAPFRRDGSEQAMADFWQAMYHLHCESSLPPLDSPVFAIIQRCLEKIPGKRYQTFKDLRIELELILRRNTGEMNIPPRLKELEVWDWQNKGASLQNLNRHEDAIRCYDKALELTPLDSRIWSLKGGALINLNRYEEAIHCFDQILQFEPSSSWAWSRKGRLLDILGHPEEAIHCFDKVLELNPGDTDVWCIKGYCFYKLGRYEEAIRCYDKTSELDPSYADVWMRKSLVQNKLGLRQAASLSRKQYLALRSAKDTKQTDGSHK